MRAARAASRRRSLNTITTLFVAVTLAGAAIEWWLDRRQARAVGAGSAAVPEAFRGRITLAAHHRAAAYTRARLRATSLERAWGLALLYWWTLGGALQALDRATRALPGGALLGGTVLVLAVLLIQGLLELPFDAWRTFRLEARFGFNRTTPALFAADLLKQVVLAVLIGAPLIALVLWLMDGAGPWWWLWAWLVWVAFNLALLWAYPVLIAPWFNRFEPLADEALRARIEGLLERQGLDARGVWVMDGSRRSGHGNAYFSGLGRRRRIVIFDTLLERLTPAEVEAVLAHEVGHYRGAHVLKQGMLAALLALLGLGALALVLGDPALLAAVGLEQPSAAAVLVAFAMIAPRLGFALKPLASALSRRHEYQADAFAERQSEPGALASALVKLYRDNAAPLTPDPLYSAWHDGHPPAPLRLARLAAAGPPPS